MVTALNFHRIFSEFGESKCEFEDVSIDFFCICAEEVSRIVGFRNLADDFHSLLASCERHIIFTFDDGFSSDITAARILRGFDLRSVHFVTPKLLGSAGYMRKKDVLELSHMGTLGSHSLTHPDLTSLSSKNLLIELSSSKKFIEDLTSSACDYFSAPYGKINHRVLGEAKACGYKYIFGSSPGTCKNSLGIMPRFNITSVIENNPHFIASLIANGRWPFSYSVRLYLRLVLKKVMSDTMYRSIRDKLYSDGI